MKLLFLMIAIIVMLLLVIIYQHKKINEIREEFFFAKLIAKMKDRELRKIKETRL